MPETDDSKFAEEAPPKKKRGCLRGCATAALIFVCIFGLFAGCWVQGVNRETRELSARIDDLLYEATASLPEVAEEDNAAELYLAAFPLYVRTDDENLRYIFEPEKATPKTVVKYVSDNKACLATLEEAAARPHCLFVTEVNRLTFLRGTRASRLSDMSRLLAAAALCEARSGNPKRGIAYVEIMLRIAEHARMGIWYPLWLGNSYERRLATATRLVLNESAPEAADLRRLLEKLNDHLRQRESVARELESFAIFIVVRAEGLAANRRDVLREFELEEGLPPVFENWFSRGLWRNCGLFLREARYAEETFDRAITIAEKPYPQALDELEEFETSKPPFYVIMTRMAYPSKWWSSGIIGAQIRGDARALAQLQMARLALGCRLYRIKHGKYPEKLGELSKELPEHFKTLPGDPFSGKPLLYARTKQGLKLWSVWKDRKDDGGIPWDRRKERGDLVYELTR